MNNIEDINVSDDYILLNKIIDKYDITVKKLVEMTGRATSTVYGYTEGKVNIPSIVWRAVYKLTHDVRIIELFIGDLPVMVVPLLDGQIKLDAEGFEILVKMRQTQIEFEQLAVTAVSTGEVNEEFKTKFMEMTTAQTQVLQSIEPLMDTNGH